MAFEITPVRSKSDLDATTALFTAYAESLDIDDSLQGLRERQAFTTEMASMPGKYAPPHGELLLAKAIGHGGQVGATLGCAGIRPLAPPTACELKRLYTTPAGRGKGVGKALLERAIRAAIELGYEEMRLDTLPNMDAAIALYRKTGFVECEAYYDDPMEEILFFSKTLAEQKIAQKHGTDALRQADVIE